MSPRQAVTWRNIGTVSGAGALAAANQANRTMGQGVQNIAGAFTDYGDDKIQQETDLAVNALRAAAPGDRMRLLDSFSKSGISMDSKQIGIAAGQLDQSDRLREKMANDEAWRITQDENTDQTRSANIKSNEASLKLNQKKQAFVESKYNKEQAAEKTFNDTLASVMNPGSGPSPATGSGEENLKGKPAPVVSTQGKIEELTRMLQSANPQQVSKIKGAISVLEVEAGKNLNQRKIDLWNGPSEGISAGVEQLAKDKGVPVNEAWSMTPDLKNKYVHNMMTTGPVLEDSQNLAAGLDEVQRLSNNGSDADFNIATAQLSNLQKNLDKSIRSMNKELVGSGINAKDIAALAQNTSNPYGALMARSKAADKMISERASSGREASIKRADAATTKFNEKKAIHNVETIYTYLLGGRNASYNDEAEGGERLFFKALSDAPDILKTKDTKWAMVEAFKELSGVEDRASWLLRWTEDGYGPSADRLYKLALSKLENDPTAMKASGIMEKDIAEEIRLIRENSTKREEQEVNNPDEQKQGIKPLRYTPTSW